MTAKRVFGKKGASREAKAGRMRKKKKKQQGPRVAA